MPTHDPLTPQQITILEEIAASPATLSTTEFSNTPRGKDILWLLRIGLLTVTPEYQSQDPNRNTSTFRRSDKPLD